MHVVLVQLEFGSCNVILIAFSIISSREENIGECLLYNNYHGTYTLVMCLYVDKNDFYKEKSKCIEI